VLPCEFDGFAPCSLQKKIRKLPAVITLFETRGLKLSNGSHVALRFIHPKEFELSFSIRVRETTPPSTQRPSLKGNQSSIFSTNIADTGVLFGMKICTSTRINDALIEIEDQEERDPENRYIVVWRDKHEENRYSARSMGDAEEYYQYRCRLAEQRRI
jgi:hypothetical protein